MRNKLTKLQQVYLIGSSLNSNLGGVSTHVYLESRGSKKININTLRKAWLNLLKLHNLDGELNNYVPYFDYSMLDKEEAEIEVKKYRRAFEQRSTDIEKNHYCGLALMKLPENTYTLHFDMNLLVSDPVGFQVILNQLAILYSGEEVLVQKDNLSFNKNDILRDKQYWHECVERMSIGPKMKTMRDPHRMHHCRYKPYKTRIYSKDWENIKSKALKMGVYGTTLAMVKFAQIIRLELKESFVLNIPVFGTNNEMVDNPDDISDRTRLLLLQIEKDDNDEDIIQRYKESIAHIQYDGLEVQKLLYKKYPSENIIAPVVFSSTPKIKLITTKFKEYFGDLYYMISQTPQVCLDAQIYEMFDGALLLWIVPENLFDDGYIKRIFEKYLDVLLHE